MTIDELRNALRARLDRYEIEQDPAAVLDPAALVDALALAEAIEGRSRQHAEAAAAVGLLHWYRYLLLPDPDDRPDLYEAVAVFEKISNSRPDLVPEPLLTTFAEVKKKLGRQLLTSSTNYAAPADDRDGKARTAVKLASLLLRRHELDGSLVDLDEAINILTTVVPSGHDSASHSEALTVALFLRYEATGDDRDLDKLITIGRSLLNRDQPQKTAQLSMIALAHYRRFQLISDSNDLDYAVELGRQAAATALPGNPELPGIQSNLSVALRVRFERREAPHDLDEAINMAATAVHTTPRDHPELPRYLTNLGLALRERYERYRAAPDLDEAINIARTAAHATSPKHTDRAGILLNLGGTLLLAGDSYAMEAVEVLREATELAATPSLRALTATYLGRASAATADWALATNGFEIAIDAVSQMAGHGFSRDDSEFHLARFASLASNAAACAVNAGEPLRAVELWEHGRGLLLKRSLDLRADLTELARKAPELGSRFVMLRNKLDREYERDMSAPSGHWPSDIPRDRLQQQWTDLLTEIRELPGFERFLDRLPVTEMLAAAQRGPIVLLNVSTYRSDAIALTADGVRVIPLPAVNPAEVKRQQAVFDTAMAFAWIRPDPRLDDVLEWLWDTVAEPVLHGLGLVADCDREQRLPRLWWCPSGPLSFLPLHMAGYHRAGAGDLRTTLDLVVSSYTPTVSALIHARRKHTRTAPPRVLAVLAADVATLPALPFAVREIEALGQRFPSQVDLLANAEATRAAVLSALATTTTVHFACHGVTTRDDPSSSGLALNDQLLTVRDLTQVQLDGTELAYLSACHTAAPNWSLADEATNLATAFQLAGFRHVVANLWSVPDKVAETISHLFYDALGDGFTIDADQAAFAVHTAMRTLRERYPEQRAWLLATIHVGS
ncbi:CHAT domain-containing protein [Amycolatopsis sp., V23-08]|uniref:CHAT domain-containing protein n=1 Tax=Amycolatopsis heterodermiae TaxID=3110235 RepID=A0ABU5RKH3_9PSEU|nr:CHAT domain-containing protein [Amycolatopsis sp., V23-08]MEA5366224.1 CHAT domain-containing protein [Amycolatopsis sp., V23-08]